MKDGETYIAPRPNRMYKLFFSRLLRFNPDSNGKGKTKVTTSEMVDNTVTAIANFGTCFELQI